MSSAPQFQVDADLSAGAGAQSSRDQRDQLIDRLRQQLVRWETSAVEEVAVFSCGAAAIDRLLPSGGLRHGMLLEWLNGHVAAGGSPAEKKRATGEPPVSTFGGTATLSLLGAREACREGGALVVIDRRQTFYPLAAAAWGIDLDRLIVVHPRNARDELWAAVQALRSPAVAAMWAAIDRLDSRAFRKLQLAAQAGRTLGVLVRPGRTREEPSWADVTLGVSSLSVVRSPLSRSNEPRTTDYGRRIQVRVLRCHNGRAGGSAVLEIDDAAYIVREVSSTYDTRSLPVVSELGDTTGHSFSARA
jgi:protein ImuA